MDNQSLIQNVNEDTRFMDNSGLSNLVQRIASNNQSQNNGNTQFNMPYEYNNHTTHFNPHSQQDQDLNQAITDLDFFKSIYYSLFFQKRTRVQEPVSSILKTTDLYYYLYNNKYLLDMYNFADLKNTKVELLEKPETSEPGAW